MTPTPVAEKELEWLLIDTPKRIKEQSLKVMHITEAIEAQKLHVEKMKVPYLQAVNNKELSNQQKHDMALEELLAKDLVYTDASDVLANEERQLRIAKIEETYLRDMFSAYKAIAGMGKTE